jgi:hypothetical protein
MKRSLRRSLWQLLPVILVIGYCAPNSVEENSTPSTALNTPKTFAPSLPAATPSTSGVETSISAQPSAQPTDIQVESENLVLSQISQLAIKGRAPQTGYDRDLFGSAWSDVDRNGCDTRNDILKRDLTNIVFRAGTGNCVVESGDFYDPYTNTSFQFVKSSTGSSIEIDHIVSLSDAWQKGAQQWNSELRRQFANDPLNLVATSREANRAKSDSDAASWLPPNKEIRCAFIARQVAVKSAYQLWVTQAEFDAMKRIIESCPEIGIATSDSLKP